MLADEPTNDEADEQEVEESWEERIERLGYDPRYTPARKRWGEYAFFMTFSVLAFGYGWLFHSERTSTDAWISVLAWIPIAAFFTFKATSGHRIDIVHERKHRAKLEKPLSDGN